jgi:immune inhibitor A
MNKTTPLLPILLSALLAVCCCTLLALGAVYYAFYTLGENISHLPTPTTAYDPTLTPFAIPRLPAGQGPEDSLHLLEQTIVPQNDYLAIACRFKDLCGIPATLPAPSGTLAVGAQASFWVNNSDTNADSQVTATLRYITPHVYFWAENSLSFSSAEQNELRNLVETFENHIYPTDREFFGSEWTPGVDGDAHIYILYTPGMGFSVAGYFSSANEYPPLVQEHSNAHEMFLVASSQGLGNQYTYGVLAHEFQHLIHWHQDSNEGELLDEGFSELATFLNGYDTGGFDHYYALDPDINLTDWHGNTGNNDDHYGANFLFVTYFLDRFGEQATQALVRQPADGLESVDAVLKEIGAMDALTGKPVTADDFFLDWTIANYLQDGSVSDGRYVYHNYPAAPKTASTELISDCPQSQNARTVNQYGVDYIHITCPGSHSLHFEGASSTRIVPTEMHSGSYAFWSNKGNNSDMTLTRQFDFRQVSAPIALTYWTWYDLEKDFDYLYVLASTDNQHWTILITPSGSPDNPTGSSFGWAYTDQSNGWRQESVDLSMFAGQQVSLRFEYITDMAVNGEGFLLDDVAVPAIGYQSDFEADNGGWQPAGFVRIENILPQTYRLALISRGSGDTTVQPVSLNPDQSVDIVFTIGPGESQEVILVVTATTRFTREIAPYQFEIR